MTTGPTSDSLAAHSEDAFELRRHRLIVDRLS